MERAYAGALPMQRALDVHETAVIAGGTGLGLGVEDRVGFFSQHRARDIRVLDRESPTEAAALFEPGKLHQIDAAHFLEETLWAVAEMEVAQAVATCMVGDAMREVSANLFEAKLLGEELRKLVNTLQQGFDVAVELSASMLCGDLGSHDGIVIAHHGDTGGGWHDDYFRAAELLDEAFEQRHGFSLIAGVVMHLSAAGLARREVDGVGKAFEHSDDCLSGVREQGVVIAGNEERDSQATPKIIQ